MTQAIKHAPALPVDDTLISEGRQLRLGNGEYAPWHPAVDAAGGGGTRMPLNLSLQSMK